MKKRLVKITLLTVVVTLLLLFYLFDLGSYLTLAYLQEQRQTLQQLYQQHPLAYLAGYFLIYVLVTALSLPGATIMTLAGGALFGLWPALIVVSFASSVGATCAFLVARFILRDWVQGRFGARLQAINQGVAKDGAFYLFSLRLVPVFPFFVINLLLGLTPIRTVVFYLVSQIGMLPGTFVYVNAGTQLAQLHSAAGILSPGLLFSFALLGLFPLLAKQLLSLLQARKVYAGYRRPGRYDYNLVVIGGGSAGLVSAYIGTMVKAKVALVEKEQMGGDCLNRGCVPSKALLASAKTLKTCRQAAQFGIRAENAEADFGRVMARVEEKIARIAPHDSVARYQRLGVDVIKGEARITSPWTVAMNGREITTRSIIIATGARPFVPPITGLDQVSYLTSDNLWQLRHLPQKLLVLGGGPIGCELSQAFARLGSEVTLVELADSLLIREDREVGDLVAAQLGTEGVRVVTGQRAVAVQVTPQGRELICSSREGSLALPFDDMLIAVGRVANSSGFGLEELGIEVKAQGTVESDPFLRTRFPNILCAGDVVGPYQLTHAASHQAWYAAVNALFGQWRKFRADYRFLPHCTFTDPEVARVGVNETEAQQQHIPYEVTRYELAELDRAIVDGDARGWIKVLTRPGSDKILGVTIVAPQAGELLAEYVLAMQHGLGLTKVLATPHSYPTLAEANKLVAGRWKQAHAPQHILTWLARYQRWRRKE